jgi:hypothetical protein
MDFWCSGILVAGYLGIGVIRDMGGLVNYDTVRGCTNILIRL